jgi:uncharacterized membrane protein
MPDNVTPFRRPKPRPVAPQQGGGMGFRTHRGKAVLVQVLTLATYVSAFLFPFPPPPGTPFVLVFASCISLALAGMPWAATHHEHAIRTLLYGFVVWTLGVALIYVHGSLAIVTVYVKLAVMIWAVLRTGVGLVLALMRKPIGNPRGLLF